MRNDGSRANSDQDKADILNQYFKSVFTEEDITSIPPCVQIFDGPCIEDVPLTVDRVTEKLKSLNVNKSPGPDMIHPKVLKECASVRIHSSYHAFSKIAGRRCSPV